MVVTINKIMFSGDEPQKKPSFWNRVKARVANNAKALEQIPAVLSEVKRVNRIKKNITEDMGYHDSAMKRYKTKLAELEEDLVSAKANKQKTTIKYIKGQIVHNQRMIKYNQQSRAKYEAILAEQ